MITTFIYNKQTTIKKEMAQLMQAITVQNEAQVIEILGWANFQEPIKGYTPLLQAVEFNNSLRVIEALVKSGANVHHKDFIGNTALHLAAIESRPDVVTFLLSCGCNKFVKNEDGKAAFDLATDKTTKEAFGDTSLLSSSMSAINANT